MQLHQGYLLSVREITTQGGPTAMRAYALGTLPFLLEFINLNDINVREVVFSENFFAADSLSSIYDYWDKLAAIGPEYGHFPKPTKSFLIVKEKTNGTTKPIC